MSMTRNCQNKSFNSIISSFYQWRVIPGTALLLQLLLLSIAKESLGRELNLLSKFGDPKTVLAKDPIVNIPSDIVVPPRPIHILALGGSTAWGATLLNRQDAYPFRIGSSSNTNHVVVVHNMAMLEMGAESASMCLQSILPDNSTNYDVLLLDFVGTVELQGFPSLIQRLRQRYPDAILIYLHIWPLKALIQDTATGKQPFLDDTVPLYPDTDWSWIDPTTNTNNNNNNRNSYHPKSEQSAPIKRLVKNENGFIYHLPLPSTPKLAIPWFSSDFWHLSAEGHQIVAHDILNVLSRMDIGKHKRVMDWFGMGDQCTTWLLQDGSSQYPSQLKKVPWNQDEHGGSSTWVLEVDTQNGVSIPFENKFSFPVTVVLPFLSNYWDPLPYSSVQVSISSHNPNSPSMNNPVLIDPNYYGYMPKHSPPKVKYARIGVANPGFNTLTFQTIHPREIPFRAVGLFLTERLADDAEDDHHDRSSKEMHLVFSIIPPDPQTYSQYQVNYTAVEATIQATLHRLDLTTTTKWTVHVLTNDERLLQILSHHKGLQLVDYRNAPPSSRVHMFRQNYVPQSANDIAYESFRMLRWIIVADYMNYLQARGVPVTLVLTLDADIIILYDDPLLIDTTVDWTTMESFQIINGAAVFWSVPGINNFANFIVDSYSTREKAVQVVKNYGTTLAQVCKKDRSLLIPCFGGDDETHLSMFHISDIYFYLAWAKQNLSLRIVKNSRDMQCLVVHQVADRPIHVVRNGLYFVERGTNDPRTLCVIHFGGKYAKAHILPFLSFIEGDLTEFLLGSN